MQRNQAPTVVRSTDLARSLLLCGRNAGLRKRPAGKQLRFGRMPRACKEGPCYLPFRAFGNLRSAIALFTFPSSSHETETVF